MTRVLLGQLGSNGDCLYATAIARQIKNDFPGCHLTWAIGSLSRGVISNFSEADEIWELPQNSWADMESGWNLFEIEAHELANVRHFDHVFLTQISPARFCNYDGTIRPSIFRNYPSPITVPVDVVISLTEEERDQVDRWFNASCASSSPEVILFECSSKSGQSFLTVEIAVQIAEQITAARQNAVVIISTHEDVKSENRRIISARELSIRQMARLTEHAHLFVGCGSGLTVAATSGAAKANLPNIQILNRGMSKYGSFRHDFEFFGKPSDHFLELTSEDPSHLGMVAIASLAEGLASAKERFDDPPPLTFNWYKTLITMMLLERGKYTDAIHSLLVTAGRYGWVDELKEYARYRVLPFVSHDPRSALAHRRAEIDQVRSAVGA